MSKEQWDALHRFIFDLTDPDMFGFAVSAEVRAKALELLRYFDEAA